jgi:uncharacterized protein (DUF305 family)
MKWELVAGMALLRDHGLEQEQVMVAPVGAPHHAPHEAVATALQQWDPAGSLAPLAACELVDLVAGLPAEQLGEVRGIGGHEVDAEAIGLAGDLEGAVPLRKADQESGRVDAGLRREASGSPRTNRPAIAARPLPCGPMHPRATGTITLAFALACALMLALGLIAAGCGGDDEQQSIGKVRANETDMAFVAQMIAHHERSVDAAEIARTEARHAQLRRLARELIQFQSTELATLRVVRRVLARAGVEEGDLGVPETELDPSELRGAAEFDRAFIDALSRHHEVAIEMAGAERAGVHAELRRMAGDISDLARFQIRQMERWRRAWYG